MRRLSDPIFTLSSGSLLADEGDEAHGERITVLGRIDRGTFTQLWGHTPWRKERGLTCPGLTSWKSWPTGEHRVLRAKGGEAYQEEVVLAKSVRPKCCGLLQKSWPEQNREGGSVQWWKLSEGSSSWEWPASDLGQALCKLQGPCLSQRAPAPCQWKE